MDVSIKVLCAACLVGQTLVQRVEYDPQNFYSGLFPDLSEQIISFWSSSRISSRSMSDIFVCSAIITFIILVHDLCFQLAQGCILPTAHCEKGQTSDDQQLFMSVCNKEA